MQTKHTPGLWALVDRGEYGFDVLDERGYTLATAWGGGELDKDVGANARLLAEAPAMLAALRAIATGGSRKAMQAVAREIVTRIDGAS